MKTITASEAFEQSQQMVENVNLDPYIQSINKRISNAIKEQLFSISSIEDHVDDQGNKFTLSEHAMKLISLHYTAYGYICKRVGTKGWSITDYWYLSWEKS